jgi:dinuclear metal center YbgI/SA1388 family protein
MSVPLSELAGYLDDYLSINDISDSEHALNGLQVEGAPDIRRVAVAVDACLATIAGAALWGADLLVVHHGMFWGGEAPLTGMQFRRFAALVRHRIGIYSAHIPLDVHPVVGNNVQLAKALDIPMDGTFAKAHGLEVGVHGALDIDRDDLMDRIRDALGVEPRILPYGLWQASRVGIITGSGGAYIAEAAAADIDTLITGEGPHHTALEAEEYGMNVIHAGHYATETVGVKALARHLEEQFGVETEFIDHPTGL